MAEPKTLNERMAVVEEKVSSLVFWQRMIAVGIFSWVAMQFGNNYALIESVKAPILQ